ncbi:uncharacterized protein LOC118565831 isoform X2 [Fundulus heteroclitus]|uniref:uncharacterized protein LOC118565831 isoform X1 n=2 Tax=Fundulus heteroclitus TaxID=8078 RepID=UPI00165B0362|nr:uncharacterized protein LOC118565831 isoform X1 [Fundulus heteroclitus]XP_036002764.1 uncharacterized protein LOC118565831 isoform X2 [Fundulus heteroclitus]
MSKFLTETSEFREKVFWEKMICRILLLIILNSCLCAATFVVNVTQSSYQAEENHSITLEWTFTTRPDSSTSSLVIYCQLIKDEKKSVIFHVSTGVEASLHLDKEFSGRVQSDKDVLRKGRIRLHVSRLRTEDSGPYKCQVNTDYGQGSAILQLNVTDEKQPQRDFRDSVTVAILTLLLLIAGLVAGVMVANVLIANLWVCLYRPPGGRPNGPTKDPDESMDLKININDSEETNSMIHLSADHPPSTSAPDVQIHLIS